MNDWFQLIVIAALLLPEMHCVCVYVCVSVRTRLPRLPNKRDNCSIFACRHIKQCVLTAWQAVIPVKLMAFSILLLHPSGPREHPVMFSINEEKTIKKKLKAGVTKWTTASTHTQTRAHTGKICNHQCEICTHMQAKTHRGVPWKKKLET